MKQMSAMVVIMMVTAADNDSELSIVVMTIITDAL